MSRWIVGRKAWTDTSRRGSAAAAGEERVDEHCAVDLGAAAVGSVDGDRIRAAVADEACAAVEGSAAAAAGQTPDCRW